MPNHDTPLSFDFTDAPGGDQTLDDIFNIGETTPSENSTTTQETQTTGDQPFLKTSTGTVYKSADDAVKGIEHKDALIAQLRQEATARTGVDPIKNKPNAEVTETYLENPKKYFEDIRKAQNEQEVLAVQGRYIQEQLAPYAPLIAGMAKSRAVEEVSTEVPEIKSFLSSTEYHDTLERYPLLKNSIQIAENNPSASGDLAQLYRMAHSSSTGMNLSKIVQTNSREAVAETRPTVSSTTTLAPGTQRAVPPSMDTSQGRKSIIENQTSRGVLDIRF